MADSPVPVRSGRAQGAPGLLVCVREDLAFASLIVANGRAAALQGAAREHFAIELPPTGRVSHGGGIALVGSGPGRWLAQAARASAPDIEALLAPLAAHAAVCDLGDSRLVVDVAGPRVREVLAKGLPIDLDPAVFATGCAAASTISHVGVQLWQLDPAPAYRVAVARSFGASFLDWLLAAAAEYGCERVPGSTG